MTQYLISTKPIENAALKKNITAEVMQDCPPTQAPHSGSKRKRPEGQENKNDEDKDEDDDTIMTKPSLETKSPTNITLMEPKSKGRKTNTNATTTTNAITKGTPERTKSNIFNDLFGSNTDTNSNDKSSTRYLPFNYPLNINWNV